MSLLPSAGADCGLSLPMKPAVGDITGKISVSCCQAFGHAKLRGLLNNKSAWCLTDKCRANITQFQDSVSRSRETSADAPASRLPSTPASAAVPMLKLAAALAAVFPLFHMPATAVDSDRGQAGVIVAAGVLGALLAVKGRQGAIKIAELPRDTGLPIEWMARQRASALARIYSFTAPVSEET